MLKQLEVAEMANVGLVMNPEKCASMRTEVVSKRKQWIVNPTSYLKLREKEIKALSITDTYKYLGVQIGPRMKYASLAESRRAFIPFRVLLANPIKGYTF